uniref:Fibulin-1 n=1 Tax=Sphaeramia orbicularis TaxID=375764 RepID=A0A673A6I2_9TELE
VILSYFKCDVIFGLEMRKIHFVCCSCCVLGLRVRSEGRGCDAHQYLGYPCGHIFLTCCEEEEEGPNSQTPLRPKQKPRPTSLPRKGNGRNRNGGCSQQCSAVGGQARCSCFPGFSLKTNGRTCEDVDECATNTHSCRPSERCVNTVGSFVCELQVTCPAGYQLKNSVCEDIDECVLRTHNCGSSFMCENTVGSFICGPKHKCISGFKQDSHGNCIDVNECMGLTEPCGPGFNCINTVGSYTCQQKTVMCSHGYHASPDGVKCVDVDECQTGTHRCGVGQICHNLPGSYRCDCQTGYQYDALRKVCNDVNECWRYPGRLCAQTCENTPGSYHCSCTAGFSLAFDGKNCEDINECEKNPCSQECANIYGSYQCYCRQGYFLKEDGRTCEDIDECSQSIGNLCTFQCVNVPGSYQCACPPHGYIMAANGRTCKDVDECTTGTHNCTGGQTCYNLQGGFRCLSFDCPPNYKKVSDTRCERLSCPTNSLDCQNSPVRITYYQLSFQTNIIIPAQIFRIGPSPAYSGDHIVIGITRGNEDGYFSTRKLNSFTGAVYLQRQVRQPRDFLIDVEMKLLRQGALTSFVARIYVFITSSAV